MSDRQSWSIRGVDREARELALRAARRRRMTIGDWMGGVLLEAARRDLGETPAAGSGVPAERERTSELAGALRALVDRLGKTGDGSDELARRIDRTEAALTGRMEQIAAAMYGVMQTVERRSETTIDGGASAPAAERMALMAERIAAISDAEARRTGQMDAIAEALAMLAARVDASRPRAEPDSVRPAAEAEGCPGESEDGPLTVWPAADDESSAESGCAADRD